MIRKGAKAQNKLRSTPSSALIWKKRSIVYEAMMFFEAWMFFMKYGYSHKA
jgi:hypothetical protein